MSDWLDTLHTLGREPAACVLVTLAVARGSTPREAGTKMIVTRDALFGSIGGGQLEYEAIRIAREMLEAEPGCNPGTLKRFPLGPSLGQCCGGVAELLFEFVPEEQPEWVDALLELRLAGRPCVIASVIEGDEVRAGAKLVASDSDSRGTLDDPDVNSAALQMARSLLETQTDAGPLIEQFSPLSTARPIRLLLERDRPADFHVVLFGAGHVGKALVSVLGPVPCRVTWVDAREDVFPAEMPANVAAQRTATPEDEVDRAPPGSYFLVMTHSHPLDQELCERVLRRNDFRYLGLIGSHSKRKRFEKRLLRKGVSAGALERLVCPIGTKGISSKHPAAIAIAVAAELLQVRELSAQRQTKTSHAESLASRARKV